MKYFFITVAVSIILFQCRKSSYDDLSGSASVKGIAIVYDTLSGLTTASLLKNAKIFLRYKENTNTFLYSTTSNATGQYIFSGINLDRSYVIYATVDTGIIKYEGEKSYTANKFSDGQSDTLKLYPASGNQNGIHLIVQDSTGGRLAGINTWVFNSPVLFAADTSAGKVFDLITNNYGVANTYNLAPVKYYFRVKAKIGNIEFTSEDSVQLLSTGIKSLVLTLRNKPLMRNGIELTVLDRFLTPASNAVSYFYRSMSVFQADTITYSQSIFKLTSDANGLASTYIINNGRYYFRTIRPINTDTLKKTDFVDVQSNVISRKTVILQ